MLRNCVLKNVNNNVGVERYMYKCSRYKGKCKYASIKVITLLYFVEYFVCPAKMSGVDTPSNEFVQDYAQDQAEEKSMLSVSPTFSATSSTNRSPLINGDDEEADFDWFGGRADRALEQQSSTTPSNPESEVIWGTIKAIVPRQLQVVFFIVLGLLIPIVLGLLGSPMPKYRGIYLHVYTLTVLTILYLPGLIIRLVRAIAQSLRRTLLWSKTDLPSYIDSISIPMCVPVFSTDCGRMNCQSVVRERCACTPMSIDCTMSCWDRTTSLIMTATGR